MEEEEEATVQECARAFVAFVDGLSGQRCKSQATMKLYRECQFLVANDLSIDQLIERYDEGWQEFPERPRYKDSSVQDTSEKLYDDIIEALGRTLCKNP